MSNVLILAVVAGSVEGGRYMADYLLGGFPGGGATTMDPMMVVISMALTTIYFVVFMVCSRLQYAGYTGTKTELDDTAIKFIAWVGFGLNLAVFGIVSLVAQDLKGGWCVMSAYLVSPAWVLLLAIWAHLADKIVEAHSTRPAVGKKLFWRLAVLLGILLFVPYL